jgi:hypothetical protein
MLEPHLPVRALEDRKGLGKVLVPARHLKKAFEAKETWEVEGEAGATAVIDHR